MKTGVLLLIGVLLLPLISGEPDLIVEKISRGEVVIAEASNPIEYELQISNNGIAEPYEIYSVVGISFSPRGTFFLPAGNSTLKVKAFPSEKALKRTGVYTFQYHLKGQNSGVFTDTLSFKVIPFSEVFSFEGGNFLPTDNNVIISINNNQNTILENVSADITSKFFDEKRVLSFASFENVNVSLPIDTEKVKNVIAGSYLTKIELSIAGAKTSKEISIEYLESESVSVRKSSTGFLLRKTTITKMNEGNVPATTQIEQNRDVLTRLFTIHSLEPAIFERKGLLVHYVWEKEIQPGESYSVSSSTNYTFPFLLVLLVIVIAVIVGITIRRALSIHKRVSFVKTRGGEFALKVILHVRARKRVENVQIIDRLPGVTQIYERFGNKPDKINHESRQLFWNIAHLNAGEERIYSYIIYTKVNIVGRFELPPAMASFKQNEQIKMVHSNRAYFVSETTRTDYP